MADKRITIRNHNGETWEALYPRTTADQVEETTAKQFVSNTEKVQWSDKAPAVHTHQMSDVSGLSTALGTKADKVHGHTISDVSGLGDAASKNTGIAPGNIPVLDGSGKLNSSVIPPLAITDTFIVTSQTAMLTLSAQKGDLAIRSDESKTYIMIGQDPTMLSSWQVLSTPGSKVESVNGRTGAVTLAKADVGLANVTNESKATMFTSPVFTGTPTAPTAATSTSNQQVATTAFVQQEVQRVSSSMPKVTVSTTPPVGHTTGDFWYESY